MATTNWKLLVNGQHLLTEIRLTETALLIYEVEVRARLSQGPFPSTIALMRMDGETITLVAETTVVHRSDMS